MGGYGSGQWVRVGSARTTEAALAIDLAVLKGWGDLRSNANCSGIYSWTNFNTGETTRSVGYVIHTGQGLRVAPGGEFSGLRGG